jgi:hypothetical protein
MDPENALKIWIGSMENLSFVVVSIGLWLAVKKTPIPASALSGMVAVNGSWFLFRPQEDKGQHHYP